MYKIRPPTKEIKIMIDVFIFFNLLLIDLIFIIFVIKGD